MKTVELSKAPETLSRYAEQAHSGAVVFTQQGKPVAALVPIDELDLESLSLGTNPDFLALIEESRARCRPGEGISTEEMRLRLGAQRKSARV